jgi:hypothetical protein
VEIKRGSDVIADVYLKETSYTLEEINGSYIAYLEFDVRHAIEFTVNDYIEYQGETYYIRYKENVTKAETSLGFSYRMTFYHELYRLHEVAFFMYEAPEFRKNMNYYTGNASQALELVARSMRRVYDDWDCGDVAESESRTFNFKDMTCADVIDSLVREYNIEYWVKNRKIYLGKREYDNGAGPLMQGGGFRSITLSSVDETPPVTRLYAYGSDINLTSQDGDYLGLPSDAKFVEKNTDKYGIIESTEQFEDIYPHGVFEVTEKIDTYTLRSSDIDFNLSEQLIDGAEARVTFQTGGLAGYDFAIVSGSWNNTSKQFRLVKNEEENALSVPGDINFAVGDKFILTGLKMPASYVSAAREALLSAAEKRLDEICENRVRIDVVCDEIYFYEHNITISCGEMVEVQDSNLDISRKIRVTGIKRYIENGDETPYRCDMTLSDFLHGNGLGQALSEMKEIPERVNDRYRKLVQYTRRRFRDSLETIEMIERALLDSFTSSISPAAVQTMALLVGDESLQFRFVDSTTNPVEVSHTVTFDSSSKELYAEGGLYLQHLTLGIDSVSSSHSPDEYMYWGMSQFYSPPLEDGGKKYYLYARVSTVIAYGAFLLSETAIGMRSVPGSYHLLMGVLNSEYNGARSYVSLYGFTEILPGRITAKRIISSDGDNFIDFLNNAVRIGNSASSIEFNTSGDGKLVLKGTLLQSQAGGVQPPGYFRGAYDGGATYYEGDQTTYNGSGYRYIHASPSTGIDPSNASYWALLSEKGAPGSYRSFIFKYSHSQPSTPSGDDLLPKGWTEAPYEVTTVTDIAHGSQWELQTDGRRKSPATEDGGFTKNRITYTAKEGERIVIRLQVSSQENDFAIIGYPNFPLTLSSVRMDSISGDTEKTYTVPVYNSGDYFIEIAYSKNSSLSGGDDCAWYEVLSGGSWWMSSSEVTYSLGEYVASAWSAPVKVTGEDGADGADGRFWDYKYMASSSQPSTPSGLNPSGWYDTPPSLTGSDMLWMSFCEKNASGTELLQSWSVPVRISGEKGADGAYYEFRYTKNGSATSSPPIDASSLDPTSSSSYPWTTVMPSSGLTEYIWMTYAKKSSDGGALLSSWSSPSRISGVQGDTGSSPALVYRGEYNKNSDGTAATLNYYGNEKRLDAVKYNGVYYVARIDAYRNYGSSPDTPFSGIIPTNTSYWNTFGAQFDSVATGLLLAESANIADWVIKDGKITSQNSTGDGTARAQLDGKNGKITFASDISVWTETALEESRKQLISIDSGTGKISLDTERDSTTISSQGVFSNCAGTNLLPGMSGLHKNGAIVGLGYGNMDKDYYDPESSLMAGVIGVASNSSSNPVPAYGGYFENLMASGLYISVKRINADYYPKETDCFLSCYNSSYITLYFSAAQSPGKIYYIRLNNGQVNLNANAAGGKKFLLPNRTEVNSVTATISGELITIIWDGQYWLYSSTSS